MWILNVHILSFSTQKLYSCLKSRAQGIAVNPYPVLLEDPLHGSHVSLALTRLQELLSFANK